MKEVNTKVEWRFIYRTRDQVYDQVRPQVYKQVWPQVYDQVGTNRVEWQVWDQVKEDINLKTTSAPFQNFFDSHIWKAFEILRGLLK